MNRLEKLNDMISRMDALESKVLHTKLTHQEEAAVKKELEHLDRTISLLEETYKDGPGIKG